MLKVVNLWAGPGAGKSTAAAGLFHLMKCEGAKVELVTEYAKELTYEARHEALCDQLSVLAEQNSRLRRLVGKVDWAITDSPIPLSLAYCKEADSHALAPVVRHLWYSYSNINFLMRRVKPYQEYGRSQNEAEAKLLDVRVWKLADTFAFGEVHVVPGDFQAPTRIKELLDGIH